MNDIKIDEKTVEISKVTPEVVIPEKVERVKYDIDFLISQKEKIGVDRDGTIERNKQELAKRDAELAEINSLIKRAKDVGIIID